MRIGITAFKNEGWLTQSGKRGVMVHPLSATEAEDLYIMRMYLEPLILSLAIVKLNHQTLGQVTDILEQLNQPKLSIAEHGELNWPFHGCIYQAAKRLRCLTLSPIFISFVHAILVFTQLN